MDDCFFEYFFLIQGFVQAVLLMSFFEGRLRFPVLYFEGRLRFSVLYFEGRLRFPVLYFEGRLRFPVLYFARSAKRDLKATAKCCWESGGTVNPSSIPKRSVGKIPGWNPWKYLILLRLALNGFQKHKPSQLIYFDLFWIQA